MYSLPMKYPISVKTSDFGSVPRRLYQRNFQIGIAAAPAAMRMMKPAECVNLPKRIVFYADCRPWIACLCCHDLNMRAINQRLF